MVESIRSKFEEELGEATMLSSGRGKENKRALATLAQGTLPRCALDGPPVQAARGYATEGEEEKEELRSATQSS